eukprot:6196934-Pleurochrysis_carterae.AAC.7
MPLRDLGSLRRRSCGCATAWAVVSPTNAFVRDRVAHACFAFFGKGVGIEWTLRSKLTARKSQSACL